jgi:putative ABC transport system permease protein
MMRFYDLLLRLYPASFRAEYGEEMCAIWARRRRDAAGPLAVAALWIASAFEVVFNAAAVHGDILRQDLRYTARTLARSPGFALTAILVLALGVGANTAAFSVTDFVLIRPLPFPEPDRLVNLWEKVPGYSQMELSPSNYVDWKHMSKSFDGMGAFWDTSVNLVGQGDPERLEGATITADLFPLLRVQPLMGRLFTAADDRDGAPGTLLLSYPLWQAVFGGGPGVIGRRVNLDNEPYEVIGVMPRDFHFPSRNAELWMPTRFQRQSDDFRDRNNNYLNVVARLKPGVSLAQARAEMGVVAGQLERQFPKENRQTTATVNFLRDEMSQQSRLLLIALSGAAICVLLIACANLANLLLARGLARQRELAVRAAMGAGRERLVRQLVTESLVLALAGGALGVLVAAAAVPLLARLVPTSLPIAQSPSIDLRVLVFAGVISGLTGIAFGVLPALRASRQSDFGALREGTRAGGGRKERLRSVLVIAEVSASVVLLVSAGLLMRALWRIEATDPGFRTDGVLTLRTSLPIPKYNETARRAGFYTQVLSAVRALPGVSSAAYISFLPMAFRGGIWPITVAGESDEVQRAGSHQASLRYVTPGFFATMGIPLHRGRDVGESDTMDAPFAAVVSESFARSYWPKQDPLGRHFKMAFHDRTVVGVVGDIRVRGLERSSEPQAYLPYRQVPDGWLEWYTPKDLVIRSATAPGTLLPAVRQIIRSADAEQPISDVRTMAAIVEEQTASRTAQVRVLGAFAAIAFLLAGVGIHGLLSFAVSRRTLEIGVRIALGARPGGIVKMIVRQGAVLAGAGVLPGVALAYAAGRALEGLLAGVQPGDAATFASAIGLCVLMTVLGSLLPALRAVRIDPIAAIRSE